ncbi:hypothetical protein ABZ591_35890 [Micromonospora fulviviridis]
MILTPVGYSHSSKTACTVRPRLRAWKHQLAAFAAETGLQVTVCHFPRRRPSRR